MERDAVPVADDKFERIEKKFWMTAEQFDQMMPVLTAHMEIDQYGYSKIRNIYCDTDDYYMIRKSIERPKFKEKLRIRSYQGFETNGKVFVEIKRKLLGIGYKRRIQIPYEQVQELLDGKPVASKNPQIDRELQEFVRRYHPKKKVYLTYERVAMYGKEDAALRITLDRNVRYRLYEDGMDFTQEGLPVMPDESWVLMEVKAPGNMPDWLVANLSSLHIYQAPYSKIGTCFTRFIAPNLHFGNVQTAPVHTDWNHVPSDIIVPHLYAAM